MKKKILSFIMASILSVALIGCGNTLANKSLESAKTFIENKDYDKALLSLEIALDEEPENGEANKLYRILEKYIESKELVENEKFHEAEEVINKLDSSLFVGLSIQEDINNLKDVIGNHNQEENKANEETKEEESNNQEETVDQELEQETQEYSTVEVQEEKGICCICQGVDVISNMYHLMSSTMIHKTCYDKIPNCSICNNVKLLWYNDSDKNGICDNTCDKLCPRCWKNEANEINNKRLCDECSWNEAYSNKATCDGCEGNIVDASLAGTICPDCGYEFKVIPVN